MLTSTGIRLLLGLATFMIIARNIPIERFGIYLLIQVIVGFFVVMSDLGLNFSASKFIVSAEGDEKKNWTKSLLVIKIGITVITIPILYAVRPLIYTIFKSELLLRFFPFIIICYLAQSFEFLFNHVLQGFYRYKQIAFADISIALSRMLLVIVFLIIFKMDIIGALYAFAFSLLIGCILLFPRGISRGQLKTSHFKKIIKFGWPIGIESILGFFSGRIYALIIAGFLGPASLALFEVASRIPEHLQRVFGAFRSVFFPQIAELFSKGKSVEIKNLVYHALRVLGLIVAFFAFLAGMFHKEIITVLFSSQYGHVSQIFFYLMIVSYFYLLGYSLWLVLLGGGFSFVAMLLHIIQVIVGIGVSLILVPRMGLIGAVYALLVLHALHLIMAAGLLEKYKIGIKKTILIKPLFPFIISFGLFLIFKPQQVWAKLIFVIPFIALSFLFSLISKEDFSILKKIIFSKLSNLNLRVVDDV